MLLLVAQSRPILCCPMDCSLPGPSVHGIFQARVLEWLAMPVSGDLPNPGTKLASLASPASVGKFFTTGTTWESESESEVTQSSPTLCDPEDCSPPGSSIHGILQARILEWVAISFSRGSSRPRDRTQVSRIAGRYF